MTGETCALVEFQGTKILTVKDGDTVRVAVKPVAEAIGLAWNKQLERIKRDPILSEGMTITVIPSEGGPQDTVTLPLDMLNGWLFGVNANKVKPAIRETVLAYQRECYRALHDYWHHGVAVNPHPTRPEQAETRLIRLIKAVRAERNPDLRAIYYARIVECSQALGKPAPRLEDLPYQPKATPIQAKSSRGGFPYMTDDERAMLWASLGVYT